MKHYATILLNSAVIFENVPVGIHTHAESGLADWDGDMALFDRGTLQAGVIYELRLDDGRSGSFLLSSQQLTIRTDVTKIHFEAAGPLQ